MSQREVGDATKFSHLENEIKNSEVVTLADVATCSGRGDRKPYRSNV
jgi:hypothetical protein